MKKYHFSCGNSTHGPVGLAGSVIARGKTEAVLKLRRALGGLVGSCGELALRPRDGSLVYVNVYINPEMLSEADVEEND